jgi:hypothetical protein
MEIPNTPLGLCEYGAHPVDLLFSELSGLWRTFGEGELKKDRKETSFTTRRRSSDTAIS